MEADEPERPECGSSTDTDGTAPIDTLVAGAELTGIHLDGRADANGGSGRETGKMLIRPADADDVADLVSLFEEWGHPLSSADVRAVMAEWGSTARSEVLVADIDGEVAGMVAVSAGPRFAGTGRYGHLSGLAVATNHRRRGVGTSLLKAAEGYVYGWGCDRLELTSSRSREAAHDFYRRHGYEETSQHHARYVRLFDGDPPSPMTRIAP